jgi:bifunctional non-homologous end joining protein LigD
MADTWSHVGGMPGKAAQVAPRSDPPHPDSAVPSLVRPMLAVAGPLPPLAQDGRYGYELKWDGVRAVSYLDRGTVRVLSRTDREVTASYPEVARLAEVMADRRAVLDGELVALDDRGRVSFGALQARMHVARAAEVQRLVRAVPVTYLVFDVLHLDGRDLTPDPYESRRALLDDLVPPGSSWQVPPWFAGGGAAVLAAAQAQGLEGVVAKRRDSRYEPGRRSGSWTKTKVVRTQDVVVAGWRPGEGRRSGLLGSLLLGVHTDEGLVFAGSVGTGFSERALRELGQRLAPLHRPTSPYAVPVPREHARDAVWVEPRLVGEVAFAEWTRDGRLRHPSWRGLRPDVRPEEVFREPQP